MLVEVGVLRQNHRPLHLGRYSTRRSPVAVFRPNHKRMVVTLPVSDLDGGREFFIGQIGDRRHQGQGNSDVGQIGNDGQYHVEDELFHGMLLVAEYGIGRNYFCVPGLSECCVSADTSSTVTFPKGVAVSTLTGTLFSSLVSQIIMSPVLLNISFCLT